MLAVANHGRHGIFAGAFRAGSPLTTRIAVWVRWQEQAWHHRWQENHDYAIADGNATLRQGGCRTIATC
jgi:hypothetical protein